MVLHRIEVGHVVGQSGCGQGRGIVVEGGRPQMGLAGRCASADVKLEAAMGGSREVESPTWPLPLLLKATTKDEK